MDTEHQDSSGAAPARARSNGPEGNAQGEVPPPHTPPEHDEAHQLEPPSFSSATPSEPYYYRPQLPEDLRVPWSWVDVMLLVVLGLVASVIVTRGIGWMAVRLFGVSPSDVFSTTVTTPMSIVVLVSQAVLDFGALLFLYVLLVTKTSAPFWPSIGWRQTRPGMRNIRDLTPQLLAGGAVLAFVVSLASGFFNTKETLPIEELLKAPVTILLFGILGVVVAPFVEETIFRGFLYPVIARRLGIGAGILITGTLFGLMHAAQLWGGWGQIALLIFVGIALTWVRARTGTVAASFFVHLGYNGLQLAGYLVYTIGRGHH
jgi:membrane protease YdiL (CAAX protease family)